MAFATLHLENQRTGQLRQAPVGFSWTTLFFGIFPALFRGHWIGALIQFLCALVTIGVSVIVFAFIYNKMYLRHLLNEGFKVADATMPIADIERRIGFRLQNASHPTRLPEP